MPPLGNETGPSSSWAKFALDLLEPEFAPMLSPTRYIRLLGMDAESLARNARVSVSAITKTPGVASIQSHLRENLRVIKAAYDVSGGDLPKALDWFRTEQLPSFSQKTAEQGIEPNWPNIAGSEDFAFMLERCRGSYVLIGNGVGKSACMIHNAKYDFNDDSLPIGAAYWVYLVEQYLTGEAAEVN